MSKTPSMAETLTKPMPDDIAHAANMLAHPLGGFAAMSALGVAFASHAFGVWMGALSGAAEVSQRLLLSAADELAGASGNLTDASKAPAVKARARARSVIEKAQTFAREIEETEVETGKPTTKGSDSAVKSASAARRAVTAPVELMPEDFRQPRSMERPAAPDDLKAISGIGPKLEKVLNGLGIWTFAQIAGWSAEEVAWVDDYLGFKGRIGRDDWLGQAAALARNETKH